METLRRLIAQAGEYWRGLGTVRRLALIAAAVAVVIAVSLAAALAPGGTYAPLASGLPLEDAGAIRAKLQELNIPSRLAAGGTSVEVPQEGLAEARVALAGQGIPARGGRGYELFDETSLGMTPFVQNVNYQRAVQAELARSVMQLEPVAYARVLIARPEPTPFVRDQRPPTASVVLKLKPGATLSRGTAAAITSLVARSVEGLKPENVTVVDSSGRLLSDPHAGERDDLPAAQIEYRRELETYLAGKAEEMLARHLGPGRAVVRVSADVNTQKVRERRETYSPQDRAVAAERLTTTRTTGAAARGVAGAVSNVSRAGGAAPTGGGSSQEEVVQTDYLVSKTVRELEDRLGAVERLTVAVMADLSGGQAPSEGGPGRPAITLADAQEVVKQAVGFRQGRDEIKVTDVRLDVPAPLAGVDEEAAQFQRIQAYVGLARNVSLAVAVVITAGALALLLVRRRRPAAPPGEAVAAAPRPAGQRERLDRLAAMARDDPGRVADVIGMMIGGGGR